MNGIVINQLLVLILQCAIVGSLILFLFRLRFIFGLSLLFTALGVFQYLQTFLVAAIYIEISPGVTVSPGSMVLFTGSLFAILLIYIREDAIEARKVIYALLTANLVLVVLQLTFSWSMMGQYVINIYNLPKEFFIINSRVLLAGTVVLFFDAFVIIFIYEIVSRYISSLFFRIFFSMAIVVSIDSLLFSLGAFAGTALFSKTLFSGLIAKLFSTVIYSIIFWGYLMLIDKKVLKLDINSKPFNDIFHTLTYRQKYEQVSLEKLNKSIELQKSEIRFKTLFDSMVHGVTCQNAVGEIIDANPAAERILGLTLQQMQGKSFIDFNWKAIHEDGSEFKGENHANIVALKTGKPVKNVIMGVFNSNSNNYRWLKVNATPQFRNSEKKAYQVFTTFEEITNERNSQKNLNELYTKYQNIIHTANIGIVELNKKGNYTFVNPAWEAMFGYKNSEVLGKHKELILPKDQPTNLVFKKLVDGEISNYQIERKYQAKTGKTVWVDSYIAANNDLHGNLNSIIGVMIDITKKKDTEEEVIKNERILREALSKIERSENLLNETGKLAKVGAWELNLETMTLYFSDETYQIYELPIGKPPKVEDGIKFYTPEAQPIIQKAVNEAIVNHIPYNLELPFITAKGKNIWVRAYGQVEVKNGKSIRLYGAIQDITEIKTLETTRNQLNENLILQQKRLLEAQTIAKIGSWITDVSSLQVTWSKEIHNIFGTNPTNFWPKHDDFLKFVHPDDREQVDKAFTNSFNDNLSHEIEHRIITLDNQIKIIVERWKVVYDINNQPIRVIGTSQDITERKKAEAEKNSLQETIENSLNEIYIFDAETFQFNYVNKGALVNLGYSENEIKTLTPIEIKPDFTVTSFKKLVAPLINEEKNKIVFFTNHKRKNGSIYPVEVHLQLVTEGNSKRFLAIILDITERKKAEHELKTSEERFRTIVEGAPDPIFIQSNKCFVYLNKLAVELFGAIDEKELLGKPVLDYFHPDFHKKALERIKRLNIDKKMVHDPFEQILIQLNGNEIWVETKGEPIFYNGEYGGLVFIRNITTRKIAESKMDEYKKSLQKLTTELMLAEEKQRKEIAANIHDHLSQSLVISKMKLNDLWNQMESNEKQNDIGTVIKHISEALENTRKITYDLSPPVLYELGLIEAIYWLAEKIENQNQINVTFETDFNEIKLSEPKLILVYRAIQEILNNAIKHSGANQIHIRFTKYEYGLEIIITDKGKGFDKSLINSRVPLSSGFGLFTVRERIENLQGKFIINSKLGIGTEVKIFVPLKANKLL